MSVQEVDPKVFRGLFHHMVLNGEKNWLLQANNIPGRVAQSVTCLATDACMTADPGVASSIQARSHTFVEIDREIISTIILLPSADSFKKGCCQLQAKVCAQITGWPLVQACPGKSVIRWTDRPAMTIAVYLGRKATKTNKQANNKCADQPAHLCSLIETLCFSPLESIMAKLAPLMSQYSS